MLDGTKAVGLALMMFVAPQQSGCMDHSIGGRNADVVFTDSAEAELARAACKGDRTLVMDKIKSGVNPNAAGMQNVTPLIWAVTCKSRPGVTALLDGGADPNQLIDGRYRTTYMVAKVGTPDILRAILKHGGDPNSQDEKSGRTALRAAFERGAAENDFSIYYVLLNAGANINYVNEFGDTVATDAALMGRFDMVAELLDRGYNANYCRLGLFSQNVIVAADRTAARDKVIEMLRERGVKFPIPSGTC